MVAGTERSTQVTAMFDSGYSGTLCLPLSVAGSLGLILCGTTSYELADGTSVDDLPVYKSKILWDDRWIPVEIDTSKSDDAIFGVSLPFKLEGRIPIDFESDEFLIEM